MSLRCPTLLATLLLATTGVAGAAELGFAHFAPGAGTARLQVDSLPAHVLDYKGYDDVTPHAAGRLRLSATRADGSVLAEGSFDLRQDDRYVVILAGNGSAQAPFQLRLATDHNHAFVLDQWSLQEASLAIFSAAGATALSTLVVQDSCSGGAVSPGTTEIFGYGTRTLASSSSGAGGISVRQQDQTCVQTLPDPAGGSALDDLSIRGRPGERLRRFLTGDGINEPYELVLVSQGIDTVYPVMTPDPSIEGLYAIEGAPNTGLQVAFDEDAPAGKQLSAVYFGFENDGRAAWRTVENVRLVEYVGGNVDGTRAAVGFDRAFALVTTHSCRELTMKVAVQTGPMAGRIFPGEPRNTVYLTRLFPPACPPSVRKTQEETP